MNKTLAFSLGAAASLLLAMCGQSSGPSGKVDFVAKIKPVLEERCAGCHNDETFAGGLILLNRKAAFTTVAGGPVITPGDPSKSALYNTLTLPDKDRKAMPAVGHRIPDGDVATIKRWIEEGATWPDGEAGQLKVPKNHKGES